APEVIFGKATTYASDIYSIGMLMWEISSGRPPYVSKHHYDLAIKIINGMRPKIIPGTPLKYRELMEQCWNANLTKRPNIRILQNKIRDIYKSYCQNDNNEQRIISITKSSNYINYGISSISSDSSNYFWSDFSSRV